MGSLPRREAAGGLRCQCHPGPSTDARILTPPPGTLLPEHLAAYFHEHMVIVSPRFQERVEGREGCVASYGEFAHSARIHHYDATEPDVHVVGKTAVATSRFAITYSIDTTDFQDSGWDVWVFARTGETWQAVWRTTIPAP